MSKPKPGLAKGVVRTLSHHHPPSSSTSHALQLAPVVSQHVYSASRPAQGTTGSLGAPGSLAAIRENMHPPQGANKDPPVPVSYPTSWPLTAFAHLSIQTPGYLSLSPTWDTAWSSTSTTADGLAATSSRWTDATSPPTRWTDMANVVLPYRPSLPRLSHRILSPVPHHVRRASYSTVSPPHFNMLSSFSLGPVPSVPPIPPSLLIADRLAPFLGQLSAIPSADPPIIHDFYAPPPPPPPSPGLKPTSVRPSPEPEEIFISLAPSPLPPPPTHTPPIALAQSLFALPDLSPPANIPSPPDRADSTSLSLYASNLIFHLGASGLAKERPTMPTSSAAPRSPPPPPRPRSFPLPVVVPPTTLKSTSVGEDAYFARLDGMCIADGVGGWARSGRGGADAGRWSRLLTHFCEAEVGDWWAGVEAYLVEPGSSSKTPREDEERQRRKASLADQASHGWRRRAWRVGKSTDGDDGYGLVDGRQRRPLDPVEIMQRGYEKCLACVMAEGVHGSSTCLLALLHHSTLHVANLGDCCLLLIRDGEVVFRTSEMQHAFNFPLQLGTHSRDEPMKDARRYDVGVDRGDVVILGSDGLMDNLFDEEILDTLSLFAPPFKTPCPPTDLKPLPTPPSSRPTSPTARPPFSPQKVSEALCRRARRVSEQTSAETPFMMKAIEEGIDFVGGKRDDISVLVGVIGEREPGIETKGLALHTK